MLLWRCWDVLTKHLEGNEDSVFREDVLHLFTLELLMGLTNEKDCFVSTVFKSSTILDFVSNTLADEVVLCIKKMLGRISMKGGG